MEWNGITNNANPYWNGMEFPIMLIPILANYYSSLMIL